MDIEEYVQEKYGYGNKYVQKMYIDIEEYVQAKYDWIQKNMFRRSITGYRSICLGEV